MGGGPLDVVDTVWLTVLLVVVAGWGVSRRAPASTADTLSAADPPTPAPRTPHARSLAARFDPRANGLNLIRLVLAFAVLVWHSYPLTGRMFHAGPLTHPLGRLLSEGPVDGFFAVSGFLIAGSWVRRPHVAAFVRSRFLRLVPAYLVCLVVTAALIAPFGILLGERPASPYLPSAVRYVVANASLAVVQFDIAGTPASLPWRAAWDGSLWTLQWEGFCYAGVLLLGVLGLLRQHRRWPVAAAFVGFTALSVIVDRGVLDGGAGVEIARLATMFAAGALVFVLRDRLPVTPALMGVAAVAVMVCLQLPDYRVPGAFPLAYLLVAVSTMVRSPRLQLRTDISYGVYIYAFPVQQLLALTPALTLPLPAFVLAAAAGTTLLALASWHLVEKRALARRHAVPGLPTRPLPGQPAEPMEPSEGASPVVGSVPKPQASIRNKV